MKKILLCGLKYDTNFGDPIINECTKYLLDNSLNKKNIEYEFDEIDLSGRCSKNKKYDIPKSIIVYFKLILHKY